MNFGQSPVRIGVIPVLYADQKHSPAAWRMTNAVESWAWNGCKGKRTTVEGYARGAVVELQLNGASLGKELPANQQTKFRVAWQPGELTAIVYEKDSSVMVAATPVCNALLSAVLNGAGYDQEAVVGQSVQSAVDQSAISGCYIWVETIAFAICEVLILLWTVEKKLQAEQQA